MISSSHVSTSLLYEKISPPPAASVIHFCCRSFFFPPPTPASIHISFFFFLYPRRALYANVALCILNRNRNEIAFSFAYGWRKKIAVLLRFLKNDIRNFNKPLIKTRDFTMRYGVVLFDEGIYELHESNSILNSVSLDSLVLYLNFQFSFLNKNES